MDITIIDWTRMGRVYCLAGAIVQAGQLRIVRPLPAHGRGSAVPNQGWSPYLLDRHTRWEVFEMTHPTPGAGQPPHLEDVWVAALRPRGLIATMEQRKAILDAVAVGGWRRGSHPL